MLGLRAFTIWRDERQLGRRRNQLGWGSVELIALWSPAVMIALEIMSTVKRVANPSAVSKTRRARMTELCPYADAVDSLPKKT